MEAATSRFRALCFLFFFASFFNSLLVFALPPQSEMSALEAIYSRCSGPSWYRRTNWMNETLICSWYGVTCESDHVTTLDFLGNAKLVGMPGYTGCGIPAPSGDGTIGCAQGNNLQCENGLPAEICQLTALKYLDLSLNNLNGPLPSCLSDMTSLVTLRLAETASTGPFPDLKKLNNLQILNLGDSCGLYSKMEINWYTNVLRMFTYDDDLMAGPWFQNGYGCEMYQWYTSSSKNQFTGTFPSYLKTLPFLRILNIRTAGLSGSLPDSLPSTLEELYLGQNSFSGPIPVSLLALPNLKVFEVGDNMLTGPIPPEITGLSELRMLLAARNQFTGEIPTSLGGFPKLISLIAPWNAITGHIPREIGLLSKLKAIGMHANLLDGELPDELGNCTRLALVFLNDNKFTGRIPPSFANLQYLQDFFVSSNSLTGPIDMIFVSKPKLVRVQIHGNPFNTSVPTVFSCPGVSSIDLSTCGISGQIPSAFCSLRSLSFLSLADNAFSGAVPECFGTMPKLESLILRLNQLVGSVPAAVFSAPRLKYVSLNTNMLSGPLIIPANAPALQTLETLDMGRNNLSGTLPSTLIAPNLAKIVLSFNQLSGPIPTQWMQLTKLESIDISSNTFKEPIQPMLVSLQHLPNLQSVDLSNNMLYGPLTAIAFWKFGDDGLWKQLMSLNLAYNQISGSFSVWAFNPSKLQYLDMSHNQLSGALDVSNANLRELRLKGNNLYSSNGDPPLGSVPVPPYFVGATGEFSCPTIVGLLNPVAVDIAPIYYNYSLCQCNKNYFGTKGHCTMCLEGGRCDGFGAPLVITRGYAPSPSIDNFKGLIKCETDEAGDSPCNPENEEEWKCRKGHNDRLCSKCIDGWYHSNETTCVECPYSLAAFALAGMIFAIMALFVWKYIFSNEGDLGIRLRIFISYCQLLEVVAELSHSASIPSALRAVWSLTSIASFQFNIVSCVSANYLSLEGRLYAYLIFVPSVVAIGCMMLGATMLAARNKPHIIRRAKIALVSNSLFLMHIIYLPLTFKMTATFDCETDEYSHKKYLLSAPWLECSGPIYQRMYGLSVLGLMLYTIGVPLLFLACIICVARYVRKSAHSSENVVDWEAHHMTDDKVPWIIRGMFTLIDPFLHSWYILMLLLRELFLGLLPGLVGRYAPTTPMCAMIVIALSAAVVFLCHPYRFKTHNKLEFMSAVVIIISLQGVALRAHSSEGDPAADWLVFVANVALLATFAVGMAKCLWKETHTTATTIMKTFRAPPPPVARRASTIGKLKRQVSVLFGEGSKYLVEEQTSGVSGQGPEQADTNTRQKNDLSQEKRRAKPEEEAKGKRPVIQLDPVKDFSLPGTQSSKSPISQVEDLDVTTSKEESQANRTPARLG
mmetsp:Transcript_44601/g.72609  ORF Transcript_44601/g.72609 Transcript_44601/m.72609 type:complete len:1369 (-) Transcript_44601:1160-5266(-)|eukprot:CAMPEP_0184334416 /NCGR_PEP_ID=MMETSP1089-20130417/3210_1 /TAXON_ID=38269 ORGANISM="Gloeochaete wittrockiana, Strain SAG46.84" /NCGR_SAMPLE_ID=MMETSP1089 /ASSEMBLY_ACC=CAM_ASM_000445 /LENGTH=1368 /DNA_ID=CAMNT_0026658671 /DNA_START=166 /DNA_END=4272 /DNA_ORIENTATION=+